MEFTIIKHIANLSAPNKGMAKELNFVSWSNRELVYDIRKWNANYTKFGKGVTLTYNEMKALKQEL